jgi:hypothetical protein
MNLREYYIASRLDLLQKEVNLRAAEGDDLEEISKYAQRSFNRIEATTFAKSRYISTTKFDSNDQTRARQDFLPIEISFALPTLCGGTLLYVKARPTFYVGGSVSAHIKLYNSFVLPSDKPRVANDIKRTQNLLAQIDLAQYERYINND